NIGDRESHLRHAVDSLRQRRITVLRSASLYLTEPRDFVDQPWFINTVAEAESEMDPLVVLDICSPIEHEARRVRDHTRGPRPIDIDILFYDAMRIETVNLTVPHPRYAERRFV